MSDDLWRPGQDDDFGDFDDDWDQVPSTQPPALPQRERPADVSGPALSFGADDLDALPHWTEPPTGEIPRLFADRDATDDLDVWSSFSPASAPVWRDDPDDIDPTRMSDISDFDPLSSPAAVPPSAAGGATNLGSTNLASASIGEPYFDLDDDSPAGLSDPTGAPLFASSSMFADADDATGSVVLGGEPVARGPIRIGTDAASSADRVTSLRSRAPGDRDDRGPRRPGDPIRGRTGSGSRPSDGASGGPRSGPGNRPTPAGATRGVKGRDMPTAVGLGLALAAVFIAMVYKAGTTGVMVLVVIIMGLAGVEFFGRVTERGYRPATIAGIAACALSPLAAYSYGERGIVVCLFLTLIASVVTAMSGDGVESGPLPNTAITMMGVVWIGTLGSFAGLILAMGEPIGTDTIFAVVVGVVANDIGALFVGSAAGRTPLRDWISPNKTLEGLIGGTVATLGFLAILSIKNGHATTWPRLAHLMVLGLVIAVLAPIGDLTESMFKRNLDVKDFGTLLPGHGGVLDRFDGFLFVLPGAYYVLTWLEPYLSVKK